MLAEGSFPFELGFLGKVGFHLRTVFKVSVANAVIREGRVTIGMHRSQNRTWHLGNTAQQLLPACGEPRTKSWPRIKQVLSAYHAYATKHKASSNNALLDILATLLQPRATPACHARRANFQPFALRRAYM